MSTTQRHSFRWGRSWRQEAAGRDVPEAGWELWTTERGRQGRVHRPGLAKRSRLEGGVPVTTFRPPLSPLPKGCDPPPSRPRARAAPVAPGDTAQLARPLLALLWGLRGAWLPPSLRLSISPLPSCGVRTRATRAAGPTAHKTPTRPRLLHASLARLPEIRAQRMALPRPLPRGCPAEKPQAPGEIRLTRAPPPPSRALCPRQTLTSNERALPPAGGRRVGNSHTGPGRAGSSLGRTRRLAPGSRAPAGCARIASSEGRPLPSGRGPAAPLLAAVGPAPSRRPRPPVSFSLAGSLPSSLPAGCNRLSGRQTRSDEEILPPK